MLKVIGKPIGELPHNAVRALKISRVEAFTRIESPDMGVFTMSKRDDPFGRLHAMSWGVNLRRETVELYSGRQFVWVGIVTDAETGKQRDNFSEVWSLYR